MERHAAGCLPSLPPEVEVIELIHVAQMDEAEYLVSGQSQGQVAPRSCTVNKGHWDSTPEGVRVPPVD